MTTHVLQFEAWDRWRIEDFDDFMQMYDAAAKEIIIKFLLSEDIEYLYCEKFKNDPHRQYWRHLHWLEFSRYFVVQHRHAHKAAKERAISAWKSLNTS